MKFAPLPGSFMITAIVGMAFSGFYILPKNLNFGIASLTIFVMMFIVSIISMVKAPIVE